MPLADHQPQAFRHLWGSIWFDRFLVYSRSCLAVLQGGFRAAQLPDLFHHRPLQCTLSILLYRKEIEGWKSRQELTLDEIRWFTEKAGHLLYLSIGGGEPFLRKEIAEIVSLFYRNCSTRFVTITTNGLQPEKTLRDVERILQECPHLVLKINLSLEAWGEKHDEIRGVRSNFRKLTETYHRLRALRDRGRYFAINIATTFSRSSQNEVIPLITRVKQEWDVNDHTLSYVRGDIKDPNLKDPDLDAYEAAIRHLEQTRNAKLPWVYRLLRAYARTMFRMNLEILRKDRMVVPCVAGRRMLTLADDGTIKPCEVLEAKEGTHAYDFGNLRDFDYDLSKLRKTERAKRAVKFIRPSKCHCSFECANMANVALSPRMLPRVLREMFRPSI